MTMLRGSGMKASATFLLLLLAAAAGGSGKKDGEAQGPVSARHSRLYGPALDSRVVTSARYLYVQVTRTTNTQPPRRPAMMRLASDAPCRVPDGGESLLRRQRTRKGATSRIRRAATRSP